MDDATRGELALRELGLDQVARRLYQLLLTGQQLTMAECAALLDCSVTTARAALDCLAASSLVQHPGGEDPRPHLLDPSTVLGALVAAQQAELARHRAAVADLRAAAAGLIARFGGRPAELEVVHVASWGEEGLRARIRDCAASAEEDALVLVPGEESAATPWDALARILRHMLERGVRCRAVYGEAVRNIPAGVDSARLLAAAGVELRTSAITPAAMIVVDRRRAVLPLDQARPWLGVVQVGQLGLAAALHGMAEDTWRHATPFAPKPPRDHRGLSPQQGELLRLLAEGLTDEAAARKLGVSVRTVNRLASALMERLGAGSRFEAGARARELGWLL